MGEDHAAAAVPLQTQLIHGTCLIHPRRNLPHVRLILVANHLGKYSQEEEEEEKDGLKWEGSQRGRDTGGWRR